MKQQSARMRSVIVGLALATCSLSGCIIHVESVQTDSESHRFDDTDAIREVIALQARAWNRGDIDAFMEGYWNSPDLSFSAGGRVTYGWRQTRDNYYKRYPNRAAMGHLTFDDLEITVMEPGVALVLGRWHLERDKPIGGAFSLVFRKIDRSWVIVHDHTSVNAD